GAGARGGYRPSAGTRGHQRIATDERESVVPGSRVVESHEAELSTAGVGPKADDVVAAEEAEPRLVQEHDRPLALHVRIGGAEVERVLAARPRAAASLRFHDRVLGARLAIGSEHDHLSARRARRGR